MDQNRALLQCPRRCPRMDYITYLLEKQKQKTDQGIDILQFDTCRKRAESQNTCQSRIWNEMKEIGLKVTTGIL